VTDTTTTLPSDAAAPESDDLDLRQMLVIRHDLKMRKGKLCAQAGHAPLMMLADTPGAGFRTNAQGVREFVVPDVDGTLEAWMLSGQKKVSVYVTSDEEMQDLHRRAEAAGLRCTQVVDAGHTEFKGQPTRTVLSIGPHPKDAVTPFTGDLPLY
jgi:PTH2 family peptidyl-tRNA hydrolase